LLSAARARIAISTAKANIQAAVSLGRLEAFSTATSTRRVGRTSRIGHMTIQGIC